MNMLRNCLNTNNRGRFNPCCTRCSNSCCANNPPSASYSLCVNITDCDTGAPLAGALVRLENADPFCPKVQNEISNAQGLACFYLCPCVCYRLFDQAAPEGYQNDQTPHMVYVDSCHNLYVDGLLSQGYNICLRKKAPVLYSLSYNANGGIGGSTVHNLAAGTLYTVSTPEQAGVSYPGRSFISWNTKPNGSGTTYAPGSVITITKNITLYAQWQPPAPQYTVTYNANGGGGGFADSNLPGGVPYTILDETQASVYRFGYAFVNWNTSPDGSGTSYAPGSSLLLNSNLMLYAQWREIPEVFHSVTYDANGGIGGTIITGLPDGTLYAVLSDTAASVSFPGSTFVNWNTNPDGSGSSFIPGNTILVTMDITLYAQWV